MNHLIKDDLLRLSWADSFGRDIERSPDRNLRNRNQGEQL